MSTTKAAPRSPASADALGLLPEPLFLRLLCLERKRAERSDRPFLLVLLQTQLWGDERRAPALAEALAGSKRETDAHGWHQTGAVLGIIYTEIAGAAQAELEAAVRGRIAAAWAPLTTAGELAAVHFTFHFFPERWQAERRPVSAALYPDLEPTQPRRRAARAAKRAIDVAGASLALALFAPLWALAALVIKVTSAGPVLFRQQRLGQFGQPFTLLKFRSMRVANDHAIHRDYIENFIAGKAASGCAAVYKIQNDPRVTSVGRLLRKTSLDEWPQFWNVLRGEMSLVGPRPPIPYEAERYQLWHHRRVLEAKPGITGLWQVYGRSRTKFDEMVRLDLRYLREWSLWLDLKILCRTPFAVLFGSGAY